MKNLIRGAIAGLAASVLILALSTPVHAQGWVDPAGSTLAAHYSGSPLCTAASFGWYECAGSFNGNNSGAAAPDELTEVIPFINDNWLTGAYVADGVANFTGTAGTINFNNTFSDFVLALKQGSGFSLYYFDSSWSGNSLNYSTAGVKTGATTGLSHWTLYAGRETSVPEPGTWFLLGTGLLGLAFMSGRRREDILA